MGYILANILPKMFDSVQLRAIGGRYFSSIFVHISFLFFRIHIPGLFLWSLHGVTNPVDQIIQATRSIVDTELPTKPYFQDRHGPIVFIFDDLVLEFKQDLAYLIIKHSLFISARIIFFMHPRQEESRSISENIR